MAWDKEHPPEEFWGSDLHFGWGQWLLSQRIWFACVAAFVLLIISLLTALLLLGANEFFPGLLFAGVMAFAFGQLYALSNVIQHCHQLYYLFKDNSFQVRVDFAGPIAFWRVLLRRKSEGTTRFTQDEIRMVSISQEQKLFPRERTSARAIRLKFTLFNGEEYLHTQMLNVEPHFELVEDLRQFHRLLDRLESVLGPDRIESPESLASARCSIQQSLRDAGLPSENNVPPVQTP
ncbi:MAG: hypothetical protein KF886_25065 [Candidatus Hydrogenedentes bacterium]|nr:hypothetical protein [Candidatus Hydrogenedentota bacterium]